MRPTTVALAINDAELRDDVRGEICRYPVRIIVDQRSIETLQLKRLPLDLIVVDTQPDGETVEQLITRIRGVTPHAVIAVACRCSDARLVIDCMRAGANHFVMPPFENGIRASLERAAALAAAPETPLRAPGKVVGFVSAKGGCGATSIACHVASAFERSSGAHVLLADLDMDTGLVGFLMGVRTQFTVVDALRNVHRLDAAFWKRHVGSAGARLDVLPSPLTAVRGDGDVRQVLPLLRAIYGWIVADLGRGLNAVVLGLLEYLDEIVLVATPETAAVFQARQFIRRLAELGYPRARLRVVVNREYRGSGAVITDSLGAPVCATIHDRPELEKAYAGGALLAPGTRFGDEIELLAARIADIPVASKPKSWGFSGLKKLAAQLAG